MKEVFLSSRQTSGVWFCLLVWVILSLTLSYVVSATCIIIKQMQRTETTTPTYLL